MRTISPLILILTSICILGTAAKDSRDFAGQFDVASVVESGGRVNATLLLRLRNYSGEEIPSANVYLRSGPPLRQESLIAANVPLKEHGYASVKVQIAISAAEYARWRQGGKPTLLVEFLAKDGTMRKQNVELSRAPMREEN